MRQTDSCPKDAHKLHRHVLNIQAHTHPHKLNMYTSVCVCVQVWCGVCSVENVSPDLCSRSVREHGTVHATKPLQTPKIISRHLNFPKTQRCSLWPWAGSGGKRSNPCALSQKSNDTRYKRALQVPRAAPGPPGRHRLGAPDWSHRSTHNCSAAAAGAANAGAQQRLVRRCTRRLELRGAPLAAGAGPMMHVVCERTCGARPPCDTRARPTPHARRAEPRRPRVQPSRGRR